MHCLPKHLEQKYVLFQQAQGDRSLEEKFLRKIVRKILLTFQAEWGI